MVEELKPVGKITDTVESKDKCKVKLEFTI